jgi:HEAT repeat protein
MKNGTAIVLFGLLLVANAAVAEDDPQVGEKPLSVLLKQLRSDNRGLQLRAAQALSNAPTNLYAMIVPQVLPILKSERENDKFVGAQILGVCGLIAKSAVPDLLPMLKGTQYERNRAAAAKALGQILHDSSASEEINQVTQALIETFKDSYVDVRREAVTACGMIGPAAKESIKFYKPLLEEPPGFEPNMISLAAAWACQRMGPLAKEHVDLLITLLHSQGPKSPAYVLALGAIGPVHENVVPNIVDVMEKTTGNYQVESWQVLASFGTKSAPAVDYTRNFLSKPPQFWEIGKMKTTIEALKLLQVVGPKAKEALPEVEVLTKYSFATDEFNFKDTVKAVRDEAVKTVAVLKGNEK